MEILAYSPKVEAYVAVYGQGGGTAYYDISEDITSCSIKRQLNQSSSFSIKLQNKGGKYNDRFTPMDRITIYATGADGVRRQQLTGYITTVSRFTLYEAEFAMSGYDSLYQLQKLYWDPELIASQKAVLRTTERTSEKDAGMSKVIKTLICDVGGWDEARVYISPTYPDEVIDFAYELYAAQKSDIQDAESLVEDFYNAVNTSGPSFGGSSSSSSGQSLGDTNGGSGTADNAQVEEACKWAIGIANDDSHGYDQGSRTGPDYDCSSLVSTAFSNAGFDVSPTLSTYYMRDAFVSAGFTWYDRSAAELESYSKLKRGDILLNISSHTELYIGGGENVGAHQNEFSGITGGETGDQTGSEISITAYWDDNWDGILRYEG